MNFRYINTNIIILDARVGGYLVALQRHYEKKTFLWHRGMGRKQTFTDVNPEIFPWRINPPKNIHKNFDCGQLFYGGYFVEYQPTFCRRTGSVGIVCERKGKIVRLLFLSVNVNFSNLHISWMQIPFNYTRADLGESSP